jgi:hypothetical protein
MGGRKYMRIGVVWCPTSLHLLHHFVMICFCSINSILLLARGPHHHSFKLSLSRFISLLVLLLYLVAGHLQRNKVIKIV